MKVLVTGVTGYIGGRLVPRLLERGYDVRCMTRDWESVTLDPWRGHVEMVTADAHDPASLDPALQGCDAAYFLIHSMKGSGKRFAEEGRRAAANFRDAADRAGSQQDPRDPPGPRLARQQWTAEGVGFNRYHHDVLAMTEGPKHMLDRGERVPRCFDNDVVL